MQKYITKLEGDHGNGAWRSSDYARGNADIGRLSTGAYWTVTTLFGQTIAATHGVDWTLDVMIAEQQCEFFRRFDSKLDRVWVAMNHGRPQGALTIDGPRPEPGHKA